MEVILGCLLVLFGLVLLLELENFLDVQLGNCSRHFALALRHGRRFALLNRNRLVTLRVPSGTPV